MIPTTDNTTLPELSPFFESLELAMDFARWAKVVIACLSLGGSTFTYMTASRLRNQTSGSEFMKHLAIADSAAATLVAIHSVSTGWLQWMSWAANDFSCKLLRFFTRSAIQTGTTNLVQL